MFVPVSCTNCGKPFQVPEGSLGKLTPCPWCQSVVTALPVSVPQEDAKPQAAGKPEPLSLDDDPPMTTAPVAPPKPAVAPRPRERPTPPAPAAKPRPVFILAVVLLGVVVLLTTMAATMAFRGYGRGHLSDRGWGEYTPPDGSFTALLPGSPVEEDVSGDATRSLGDGKRFTVRNWYSKTSVWVAYHDLDPALVAKLPSDRDRVFAAGVLAGARDREVARLSGTITKEVAVRLDAAWGIEIHLDTPEGTVIERLLLFSTGSRPRLYILGVQAKDITPDSPVCRKLFDRFRTNE